MQVGYCHRKNLHLRIPEKNRENIFEFVKFSKFLDLLYDATLHLRHGIKSTLLSSRRIKSNREKNFGFRGHDGIYSAKSTNG